MATTTAASEPHTPVNIHEASNVESAFALLGRLFEQSVSATSLDAHERDQLAKEFDEGLRDLSKTHDPESIGTVSFACCTICFQKAVSSVPFAKYLAGRIISRTQHDLICYLGQDVFMM